MRSGIVTSIVLLTIFTLASMAGEPQSPKQVGISWAKMSDQAQIQLLVNRYQDRLTASSQIIAEAGALLTEPAILVEQSDATVVLENGSELSFKKIEGRWTLANEVAMNRTPLTLESELNTNDLQIDSDVLGSAGQTFLARAVSQDHGVERLSRDVTRSRLDRDLFSAPERTAAYYSLRYSNSAPYVSATYIQLVADPAWNRILYGSMDRWIKSYDNIDGPTDIAVDADGRVFVGESRGQRVIVLQLSAENADTELSYRYDIRGMTTPSAISHSDNGTPLNTDDDLLYVADASENKLFKFALHEGSASLINEYDGFESPLDIATGKWNGASSNQLYVVDKIGKRIRYYEENDAGLTLMKTLTGNPNQYFSSISIDHFGQVYLVDNVNSGLYKFTADLEFLDAELNSEQYQGLFRVDIPFGKISIEGEGTYWTGFDQLFALERWTNGSGMQRRQLGLAIKSTRLEADADVSSIAASFLMTEYADVTLRIMDMDDNIISEAASSWMSSGQKSIAWDRRDDSGYQVAPGNYRYEISASSAYNDEQIRIAADLFLPAYYWQNSGADNAADDQFLVQGTPVRWGDSPSETANEHSSAVIYRFDQLNPESEYAVNLEAYAGDGVIRNQVVLVDGIIIGNLGAGATARRSGYIDLPAESYTDGSVTISIINEDSRNSAVVSQVWFKETGTVFSQNFVDESSGIPTEYALEQNYPNPFNPSTTIRYQIPENTRVRLEVFNVLGQKISVLVDGLLNAGSHTVQWDGRSDAGAQVTSGIYFYRLATDMFVETQRMLLIK